MPNEGTGHGLDLIQILAHATIFGKLVFVILIGCSILSIAVIIERWITLKKARQAIDRNIEKLDEWSKTRNWSEARRRIEGASRERDPLFSVLRSGIVYWRELAEVGEDRVDVMESMVSGAVTRELKLVRAGMRLRLPILANVASVAPFIGLFGTVTGIIATFDTISRTGSMGQELVASGIAEALVATALGLFAAIPAVVGYNAFVDQINTMILTMEESALERIYFLVQRSESVL